MKVQNVIIHFSDAGRAEQGRDSITFSEGEAFKELHYIVRDGMAVVNYSGADKARVGYSVPLWQVSKVSTSTK